MIIRNFYTGMYDYTDGFVKRGHSVNAISVQGNIQNTQSRTIKYATLSIEPLNRVGDPVECEVQHHCTATLKITGPIEPGKGQLFVGQNLWVNSSITNARVTRIELIYMDGTTETLCGNDIEQNNLSTASERDKNPKEWLGVALIWGALFLLLFLIVKLL